MEMYTYLALRLRLFTALFFLLRWPAASRGGLVDKACA
jgi:hypothetical protein